MDMKISEDKCEPVSYGFKHFLDVVLTIFGDSGLETWSAK